MWRVLSDALFDWGDVMGFPRFLVEDLRSLVLDDLGIKLGSILRGWRFLDSGEDREVLEAIGLRWMVKKG